MRKRWPSAAWSDASIDRFRRRLEDAQPVAIYIVDVGATSPTNDAIGSLKLSGDVLSDGQTLRIRTNVSRLAPTDTPPTKLPTMGKV